MFFSFFTFLYSFFTNLFLAGYITNKNSFPKPLSREDENKYLTLAYEGDENARNILIERNLRLVAHIAKKYSQNAPVETEDLLSVGTIGLIKAIDSFDSSKKIRLATYASRCIQNEILMLMRSNKHKPAETSLQDPIGTDSEGNSISLLNIIGSDDEDITDMVHQKSRAQKLYAAINTCLTDRERKILQMRFGLYGTNEITQREIAKQLNISRSYVSRIEKKATEKLKKFLSEI